MIEGYIKSDRSEPLVIHGRSGSGKTSVVAMAARSIDQWLDGKARVFLRFVLVDGIFTLRSASQKSVHDDVV